MPWKELSRMSLRQELVTLMMDPQANVRALCRRYGVSPKTAYKWRQRFRQQGADGLVDRSRRPRRSPGRTAAHVEKAVVAVRAEHPAWGGRKIRRVLANRGHRCPPAPSTITDILRRHDRIDPQEADKRKTFCRFERSRPNELWQMDFKGHFPVGRRRCHPLTILDDHSRFSLALRACGDQKSQTVQDCLTDVFVRYGLPEWILTDNGSPWGSSSWPWHHSMLTAWLIRLGVDVTHGRPYHPQTQGKDERFHRTLNAEVLRYFHGQELADYQREFDRWRDVYNLERPHEALDMQTPASRYQASPRPFPEALPPIEYGPADIVRKVSAATSTITFHKRRFKIGNAFRGYPVALRPTTTDGQYDVFFCAKRITRIDLRQEDAEC